MNSLENKTLENILETIKEQNKHSNELTSEIIKLVKESTTATTTANGINKELTEQLKGIKNRTWFDLVIQVGQIVFVVVIGSILIIALIRGKNIKYANFEITNAETTSTMPTTQ